MRTFFLYTLKGHVTMLLSNTHMTFWLWGEEVTGKRLQSHWLHCTGTTSADIVLMKCSLLPALEECMNTVVKPIDFILLFWTYWLDTVIPLCAPPWIWCHTKHFTWPKFYHVGRVLSIWSDASDNACFLIRNRFPYHNTQSSQLLLSLEWVISVLCMRNMWCQCLLVVCVATVCTLCLCLG